jgi:hypothetical protein
LLQFNAFAVVPADKNSNVTFVLYTHTNLAPLASWSPILTNQFDQFGVFTYTNLFNPAELQRYFRLVLP